MCGRDDVFGVPLRIGDGDHYTCTWPLESHLTPRGSGLGIVFILVRAAQRYRAAPVSPVEWTKVTGARHRTFLVVDGTAVLRPLSVDLLVLSERDVEVGDDHDLWDGISHMGSESAGDAGRPITVMRSSRPGQASFVSAERLVISLELCLHQRRDSWRQECNSRVSRIQDCDGVLTSRGD